MSRHAPAVAAFVAPLPLAGPASRARVAASSPRPTLRAAADADAAPTPQGPTPTHPHAQAAVFARAYTTDLQSARTPQTTAPHDTPGDDSGARRALSVLLGHAHVFESELRGPLAPILSRFAATRDAQALVRSVLKSPSFVARYVRRVAPTRAVELLYRAALARAPADQTEVADAVRVAFEHGYDGLVDSLVDSPEYAARFGTRVVPDVRDAVAQAAVAAGRGYVGGMPAFNALARAVLPVRPGGSDAIAPVALGERVRAAGERAGVVDIRVAYDVLKPEATHVAAGLRPGAGGGTGSAVMDYASRTLLPSAAAVAWAAKSAGPRRPVARPDEPAAPWRSGWAPQPAGERWTPGWFAPGAAPIRGN